MINFRFHLVSLVAVFLALAVGIVMGYGVLGQPTVNTLQNRIDVVEANAEARRVENDELRTELDQRNTAIAESSPFSVTDRLVDVPTVVLAVRGIDEDAVERVVDLARRGGAAAPGVIWLESKWALDDPEQVEELASALGLTATGRRAPLRGDALDALLARVSFTFPQSGTDPLRALADAGFITIAAVGEDDPTLADIGAPGTRVALVAGVEGSVPARLLVEPIARLAVDQGVPLVAAEVFAAGDDRTRGGQLAPIRDDEDGLGGDVSTVDDVDRVEGAVATVLALSDLGRGVVGHYGIGQGADQQLPEWWQP